MSIVFEHLINNRVFTAFKAIEQELELKPEKNYLFDLSYLNVLEIEGDKAIDFLQGQLSCDLNRLSALRMIQGAQCNLQGRILTLMDIIAWQGVKLLLPNDLVQATLKSLSTTAALSRVSLKNNLKWSLFGVYLQNQEDIVPQLNFSFDSMYTLTSSTDCCSYYLGNGFHIILVTTDAAQDVSQCFREKDQFLGSLTWHTLRLAHQHIDIYPESRGLFLPHRLGLQHSHYLSFNKGCYKGQEIIARMHYKATVKHQMNLFKINTEEKIYSGQKLFNKPEGKEVGELIDYSILAPNHYLVAVSLLNEADHKVFFSEHNQPVELDIQ